MYSRKPTHACALKIDYTRFVVSLVVPYLLHMAVLSHIMADSRMRTDNRLWSVTSVSLVVSWVLLLAITYLFVPYSRQHFVLSCVECDSTLYVQVVQGGQYLPAGGRDAAWQFERLRHHGGPDADAIPRWRRGRVPLRRVEPGHARGKQTGCQGDAQRQL